MRVILLNGSPHEHGCTYTGLSVIRDRLATHGVDSTIYWVGVKPVPGCMGCGQCGKLGHCVFDDQVRTVSEDLKNADGLIIGSAVHYASASGAITSFCDRLFYSTPKSTLRFKFGASVVSCRRGGASATFDQLNKYFTISQMPVVSSCYWNSIHGFTPEDVMADKEGVRTLQVLADNMAYLIRCKQAAGLPYPEEPPREFTCFSNIQR